MINHSHPSLKLLKTLVAGALLLNAGGAYATVYKWVDEDGKVQFSDRPPPKGIEAETPQLYSGKSKTVDSFAVRKAAQNFPVRLFTADNCGAPCDSARKLLNERGIPFSEVKVDGSDESRANFHKIFGEDANRLPAATVGRELLNGFEAGQWNSQLTKAGYPKEAPPKF